MKYWKNLDGKVQIQEISIVGGKVYKYIRMVGTALHFVAFIIGILITFNITFAIWKLDGTKMVEWLEFAALIVLGLLAIERFMAPRVKRILLHKKLSYFWGNKEIDTIMYKNEGVSLKSSGYGKISSQKEIHQKEKINIQWIRTSFWTQKKFAIVTEVPAIKKWKAYANEEGMVVSYIVPEYVIIDVRKNLVKLSGTILFDDVEDEVNRELQFEFDINKKKATWSGVFPNHPFYGRWKWREDDPNFIIEESKFKNIFKRK